MADADNVISSLTTISRKRQNKEEVVTTRVPRNNNICRVMDRRKSNKATENTTIIRSRMSLIFQICGRSNLKKRRNSVRKSR